MVFGPFGNSVAGPVKRSGDAWPTRPWSQVFELGAPLAPLAAFKGGLEIYPAPLSVQPNPKLPKLAGVYSLGFRFCGLRKGFVHATGSPTSLNPKPQKARLHGMNVKNMALHLLWHVFGIRLCLSLWVRLGQYSYKSGM